MIEFTTDKSKFPFHALLGKQRVTVAGFDILHSTFIYVQERGWTSVLSDEYVCPSEAGKAYQYVSPKELTPIISQAITTAKKWKDTTKAGYKILQTITTSDGTLTAGIVELTSGSEAIVRWDVNGKDKDYTDFFDLVPAEPEVEYFTDRAVITTASGINERFVQLMATGTPNLKLGFVGGKLVSAEVLK